MRILASFGLVAALSIFTGCAKTPMGDLLDSSGECDLKGVQAALAAKADINGRSAAGETPLMEASYNGCVEVAQALLAAGADVNAKSTDTKVPEWAGIATTQTERVCKGSNIVASSRPDLRPAREASPIHLRALGFGV